MREFIFICSVIFCLSGCHPTGTKEFTLTEEASASERILSMTGIIGRNADVPSEILEANYVEYKKGDGVLGPSDFSFYARIRVDKNDLPKWSKELKPPYNNTTEYSVPKEEKVWWLPEADFQKLKLFEAKKYFARFNGWMAVDEATGYIYIHTFTM